jgi:hypothetical protein
VNNFELVRNYGPGACSNSCYWDKPDAAHTETCGKAALARIEAERARLIKYIGKLEAERTMWKDAGTHHAHTVDRLREVISEHVATRLGHADLKAAIADE